MGSLGWEPHYYDIVTINRPIQIMLERQSLVRCENAYLSALAEHSSSVGAPQKLQQKQSTSTILVLDCLLVVHWEWRHAERVRLRR